MKHETGKEDFVYVEFEENGHEVRNLHIWLNRIIEKDCSDCPRRFETVDYMKNVRNH